MQSLRSQSKIELKVLGLRRECGPSKDQEEEKGMEVEFIDNHRRIYHN